jgi:hypothetical protein
MLARKKLLRYKNNKFTLHQKVIALLSLMRKITQLQKMAKNIYINLYYCFTVKCKCGAVVELQTGMLENAGSIPTCAT